MITTDELRMKQFKYFFTQDVTALVTSCVKINKREEVICLNQI
ncbi:hypothetical protein BCAH1134_0866 [Bacillus cereus AH1134]|nr:hypothetical protein BCAH1134_0866 [Bacillus cereus AH1134]